MRENRIVRVAMAGAILMGGALSGCGGSTSSSSTTSAAVSPAPTAAATTPARSTGTTTASAPSITRSQYIAKVDAICADFNKKNDAVNRQLDATTLSGSDSDRLIASSKPLRQAFGYAQAELDSIRRVPVPTGSESAVKALIDARDAQVAIGGQIIDAASDGDVDRYDDLTPEVQRAQERAEGAAQGFGLKNCGSGR